MPTQSTTYNSRVTDEALEKKFRDTFKSQGGAELVDDLYASGVIVPIVDFTAAAQGSELRSDLQNSYDFSTGNTAASGFTATIITTPGFWKIHTNTTIVLPVGTSLLARASVIINDGTTSKVIYNIAQPANSVGTDIMSVVGNEMTVFVRSGDSVQIFASANTYVQANYRQIADVSGNLVNPLGFTSS